MKNEVIKRAIVQGTIRAGYIQPVKAETLYYLLLNADSLKRLKPFNYYKYVNELPDTASIFKQWLVSVGSTGSTNELAACKRIERAIHRVADAYLDVLPACLQGDESFSLMLRVFFLTASDMMSLDTDCRAAATTIAFILQVTFLMELLFSNDTVFGYSSDELLARILNGAGANISAVVSSLLQPVSKGR